MRFQDLPLILGKRFVVSDRQLLDNFDRIETQAQEIHAKYPERDYEQVLRNCFDGTAAELGVMNALNEYGVQAYFNLYKHDKRDPETFAYDLESKEGQELRHWEIKSMNDKRDMVYFSFNVDVKKPGLDLTTFLEYGTRLSDFMILTAFEEDKINCSYDVYPKYAFDSRQFKKHVKRTHGGYLTHYIEIAEMIAAGHCLLIQ